MRYKIPGDVVATLVGAVGEAFDGVRLAALATNEGDSGATAACLAHIAHRLDLIYEALAAVVTEQEDHHGIPRPS